MISNEALWALGRGTGITALVMLTVSMVLGVLTRSGRPMLGLPRFGVLSVHQFASLAATALIALHVTTLVIDPYAQLDLVDVIIPFGGSYEWLWVGLGTLALDLMIVLVVTALLRHRLGHRTFRVVHWAAYALWPIALAHGMGSGTDAGTVWMIAIDIACIALVVSAIALRLRADFTEFSDNRKVALR
ncbi:ferric reductase-like transmembrane domain-containing protein [Williamsia sp. CHRR-6]|uniref:ferric reductase-like transmembrane domain-containing protein n=1 Tax=Williamsia sp. CHRR-6 TaxID=2835871 RepID=UPI001BD9A8F2|nr:ferric reductase-like transmembrane domain-containing protein [Williamsia sp. CHRR-6]MBT0567330.1 ferric reductase-like transmembrane domain-containing protein [Williamsia sp. CHRR-6]